MSNKHTPAPWEARCGQKYDRYIIVDATGDLICSLSNIYREESESANAKLIAASPDLFEALVKVVENLSEIVNASNGVEVEGIDLYEACESLKQSRAAIAKVRGKS